MFNSNNSIGTAEPGDVGGEGEGRRRRRGRGGGGRGRGGGGGGGRGGGGGGLDKSMLRQRCVSRI